MDDGNEGLVDWTIDAFIDQATEICDLEDPDDRSIVWSQIFVIYQPVRRALF